MKLVRKALGLSVMAAALGMALPAMAQQSGMSGMSGMSGQKGMSGMSGQQGMSGMSGMSGQQGMSGMSGMSGNKAKAPAKKKKKATTKKRRTQRQQGMSGMSGTCPTEALELPAPQPLLQRCEQMPPAAWWRCERAGLPGRPSTACLLALSPAWLHLASRRRTGPPRTTLAHLPTPAAAASLPAPPRPPRRAWPAR